MAKTIDTVNRRITLTKNLDEIQSNGENVTVRLRLSTHHDRNRKQYTTVIAREALVPSDVSTVVRYTPTEDVKVLDHTQVARHSAKKLQETFDKMSDIVDQPDLNEWAREITVW